MRISRYLKFSFEFLTRRKRQFLLLTLITVSGVILLAASLALYESTKIGRRECDKALRYGNDKTGYMVFPEYNKDIARKYIKCAESAGLKAGYMCLDDHIFVGDLRDELIDIQRKLPFYIKKEKEERKYGMSSNGLDGICMSSKLWDMCKLELSEGSLPTDITDDEVYIYVGSNLDVEIGKECVYDKAYDTDEFGGWTADSISEIVRDRKITYKIMGKLKKGTKIMSPDVTSSIRDYINQDAINLDDMVLVVTAGKPFSISAYDWFFYADNPDEFNEKIDKAFEKENTYNGFGFGTITEAFDSIDEENSQVIKFIVGLTIIIMFSVIIIQGSSQTAEVIGNVKEYGIFFANGFTKANIIIIMIIEVIIRFVISSLIAGGLLYAGREYLFMDARVVEFADKLFIQSVIPKTLLVSAAVLLIAQMIPMIFISRIDVATLTKANE